MSNPKSAHPRFRRSELFSGWEWMTESSRYEGTNSDMHWLAWTENGVLFTVDDDGQNFGSPWNFANLMRVEGTPPHHVVSLASQFPELIRPDDLEMPPLRRRRARRRLTHLRRRLRLRRRRAGLEEYLRLRGPISPNGGVAALMYSDDRGQTLQNVPSPDVGPEDYFLGPRFAGLSFVSFGPGATAISGGPRGYLYALSNDSNWETGDHIFLARAPRDTMLDRSTWEFFAAAGEGSLTLDSPTWSRHEHAARPILRDPGRIGHPTMTTSPAWTGSC